MSGNDYVAAVLGFEAAFSPQECGAIRTLARELPLADVDVYPPPSRPARQATTRILPTAGTEWIVGRILSFARRANERLDVDLGTQVEGLMHVSYAAGDFFDWHTDLSYGPESTRKISVSVQLSDREDYAGGELEIASHGVTMARAEQGFIALFPSHLAHRIHPVTQGVREALVTWVHGPPFR